MDKVEKHRIGAYVTTEMKNKIVQKADELGISMSSLIVVALDEYFKQDSVVDLALMFRNLEGKFGGSLSDK